MLQLLVLEGPTAIYLTWQQTSLHIKKKHPRSLPDTAILIMEIVLILQAKYEILV